MKATPTYFLALVCILFALSVQAQTVPLLRCISLDDNDDITLYWEQPADTGSDFNQYLVYYRSGATANFSILSQVTDYNQNSVLVTGSFAGSGSFFIVQVYNGFADTSLASDTVSPLVVGISSNGKRISLGWNHSGLLSEDSIYRVYKQDTGGVWPLFKKLDFPGTATQDTIALCTEAVAYRVETKGIGGCISRSNLAQKLVIDEEPPQQVSLSCASVDTATGAVRLEWPASKSKDTYGYLVFYFEDFVRTDTSFGESVLSYTFTDNQINGLMQPETLSVAPFDSCFDSTNMWYNQAPDNIRFVTLFIDTISFERCAGELAIKWSHPKAPFALGVRNLGGFGVYRQTNGGPSQRIATLSAMDSLFVDQGLEAGNKYTYVVTCIDATTGKEAMSNKLNFDLKKKKAPKFFYISSVKNNHANGNNRVHVLVDTISEAANFGLFRAMEGDDRFVLIEKENANQGSAFFLEDFSGKAGLVSYRYKIAAYDACDDIIAWSQAATSVHVSGTKNARDLINAIDWNAYEGFDSLGNGVLSYELYRSAGMDEAIGSYTNPATHLDDIGYLPAVNGQVCYFVKVPENGENSYGIQDTSVSNLLCLSFPAIAFVPNTFSPDGDGVNDVFQPFVNFIDQSDYHLVIYDRVGRMVFETDNPDMGWTGEGYHTGTYAFHLSLRNAFGEAIEQTGKVHLIR
ncbi:MAG: gliding motility-associated C-terminal domain-containing protein [Cryomorphaceae bacterium]